MAWWSTTAAAAAATWPMASSRAPADGYTLPTSYSAYHVGNPSLSPRLPWARKDFTPIW